MNWKLDFSPETSAAHSVSKRLAEKCEQSGVAVRLLWVAHT